MASPIAPKHALFKQQGHLKLCQHPYYACEPKDWAGKGWYLRDPPFSLSAGAVGWRAWGDHKYLTADVFQWFFLRAFLFLLFNVLLVNHYNMSGNTFTTWKFQKLFWLSILTQMCQELMCNNLDLAFEYVSAVCCWFVIDTCQTQSFD